MVNSPFDIYRKTVENALSSEDLEVETLNNHPTGTCEVQWLTVILFSLFYLR